MLGYIIIPTLFILGLIIYFFSRVNNFASQFKSQGGLASKLIDKEIENWKNRGLNGKEAGQSYNNGWTNPENPRIQYGKVTFYSNYQQSDSNFNPAKVSKFELDKYYKILSDIVQDNNPNLNYTYQIDKIDYTQLPLWRQRSNLISVQSQRKYDLILQNIQQAKTIAEVNEETFRIKTLNNDYLPSNKKKINLIKTQNNRLNDFLNEEQRQVVSLIFQKKNIFFTGSAGTGKSFLLQRIIIALENLQGKEKVAVTATTGIAAINIGGVTLHSFSGIGFDEAATAEELVNKIERQKSKNWIRNWRTINTLIIDEVSMLNGKLFDKLEYIARKIRRNNLSFGGLQLILTGDFFQLPPIKSNNCFEANKWKDCLQHTIQLVKIYRQEEPELIDLLNELRFGQLSSKSWETLKKLETEPNWPNDGIRPTQLMATNREINEVNSQQLNKINSSSQFYQAIDFEDKRYSGRLEELDRNFIAPKQLELKVGAQVMLVKNLSEKLVNGCQGIVTGFRYVINSKLNNKYCPVVKFTNGIKEVIKEEEWTIETPIYRLVRASRTQIPLVLSWAITIHKSQGQSIERLKINLNRVFEKGQVYVALSRACSLKYLQVIGFNASKLICDEKVKKFYQDLITFDNI
ncbi:DEAD/DEAH box helicase [endosymbiont GvMRE of Glomus versiforme]|uniref:DEAD/DEAH box helicase n=1 Tax=endosymbiont GvMRE of Glomus versiforme TaxID=2039283 RepID=UPI000ECBD6CD|nr:PIF1 family ATP-dependent DNA helicase [endosymbiont GvMRE of Glomus versiforme]RHZ35716.1 ATP-dependent DNA helicase PIF1 [endosymbiont GvMRE of Glomus versiforme]